MFSGGAGEQPEASAPERGRGRVPDPEPEGALGGVREGQSGDVQSGTGYVVWNCNLELGML